MEQQSADNRVAFFGGSFDPPHLGHLAVARAARAALQLDTVLFAPVGAQPLKPSGSTAGFQDRLAMTRLAIAADPGFEVSLADAPHPSGKPNFTIETLLHLRASLPRDVVLFCLMGADVFFGLRGWHRAAEIPFVAPLIVASRPGQHLSAMGSALPDGLMIESSSQRIPAEFIREGEPRPPAVERYLIRTKDGERAPFYILPGLEVETSASQAREVIHTAFSAPRLDLLPELGMIPPAVLDYISLHGLYR